MNAEISCLFYCPSSQFSFSHPLHPTYTLQKSSCLKYLRFTQSIVTLPDEARYTGSHGRSWFCLHLFPFSWLFRFASCIHFALHGSIDLIIRVLTPSFLVVLAGILMYTYLTERRCRTAPLNLWNMCRNLAWGQYDMEKNLHDHTCSQYNIRKMIYILILSPLSLRPLE
jgi:hypothetical protein